MIVVTPYSVPYVASSGQRGFVTSTYNADPIGAVTV